MSDTQKPEYRVSLGLEFEERSAEKPRIKGYPAVFNRESVDFGWFKEVIREGAFAKSLKEQPDVRALLDHNTGTIIGRTKAKNLELKEDSTGLSMVLTPIDTEDGRKAVEWVRSGVVDGMSIGFRVMEDRWSIRDGKNFREILEIRLYEVSLVAFPAYPDTSAAIRAGEMPLECRSLEEVSKYGEALLKEQAAKAALKQRTEQAKRKVRLYGI